MKPTPQSSSYAPTVLRVGIVRVGDLVAPVSARSLESLSESAADVEAFYRHVKGFSVLQ